MPDALQAFIRALPEFSAERPAASPLIALYADLSAQKHSNRGAYRAKVDWWASTLQEACWRGVQSDGRDADAFVLHLDSAVPNRWAIDAIGKPLGIAVVVKELAQQRRAVRLSEFLCARTPVTARPPMYSRLWSDWIAQPTWETLSGWLSSDNGDELGDAAEWERQHGDWVLVGNVQRAASLVLAYLEEQEPLGALGALQTRDEFRQKISLACESKGPKQLTNTDKDVLMRYLEREKRRIAVDGDVVKLVPLGSSPTISEEERGIVAVRVAHEQLSAQIEELQRRIDAMHAKVQATVQAKRPQSQSLSYLRTRKQLEGLLEKRVGALETVSQLLLKLEQAVGDAAIVRTYETSAKTLQAVLADPALQRDKIDETMDQLAEATEEQRDVHEAVASGAEADGVDEDELARELEALAIEERAEAGKQPEAEAPQLPSAPQHVPEEQRPEPAPQKAQQAVPEP